MEKKGILFELVDRKVLRFTKWCLWKQYFRNWPSPKNRKHIIVTIFELHNLFFININEIKNTEKLYIYILITKEIKQTKEQLIKHPNEGGYSP